MNPNYLWVQRSSLYSCCIFRFPSIVDLSKFRANKIHRKIQKWKTIAENEKDEANSWATNASCLCKIIWFNEIFVLLHGGTENEFRLNQSPKWNRFRCVWKKRSLLYTSTVFVCILKENAHFISLDLLQIFYTFYCLHCSITTNVCAAFLNKTRNNLLNICSGFYWAHFLPTKKYQVKPNWKKKHTKSQEIAA